MSLDAGSTSAQRFKRTGNCRRKSEKCHFLRSMLRRVLLLAVCAGLAFAAQGAGQGLVLQDDSSALYVDDELSIVDLIDTQLPLRSFLAPLHVWWSDGEVWKYDSLHMPFIMCCEGRPSSLVEVVSVPTRGQARAALIKSKATWRT